MTNPDDPNVQQPPDYQQPPAAYQPPNYQPPPGYQQPAPGYQPPPAYPPAAQPGYQPPQPGYVPAPPVPAGYGYGQPGAIPPGMYFDPASGLTLPQGVQLASIGRRIGAYFLTIALFIVTLGIGYIVWGLIAWGKGTSPSLQVLGMKIWKPEQHTVATFGTMALRDIVGTIATGILGFITELVSFVMFLSGKHHKTLADTIASTIVVHDPGKVLG